MTDQTTPKNPIPVGLQAHAFKKGQSGNPLGRSIERTIDGVKISKVFNENLGPAAVKVIEKVLHAALNKPPEQIKAFEIDLAKFMHDKVYGKAIERMQLETSVVEHSTYVTSSLTIEQMEMIAGSVIELDPIQDSDEDDSDG